MSGEVEVGRAMVPISRPITLQGGMIVDKQTQAETFVGALNGETLTRTPLLMPGGLLGLIAPGTLPALLQRLYAQSINSGSTAVSATTELVRTPRIDTRNLEIKEGTVLSLPVRIKLGNEFLGSECYIGSSSNPVVLELTGGKTNPPKPNMPIAGRAGYLFFKDEFNFVEVTENSLVDNSFSMPRATGCGGPFSSVLDPLIDAKLGLPSPAGGNTAIFSNNIQEAGAQAVVESEK